MKLCECGCGEPTPPAKTTDRRKGTIRGQPLRFVPEHRARRAPRTLPPPEPRLCACGCGRETPIAAKTDARRGIVKGEPTHCLPGHDRRPAPACDRSTLRTTRCRGCGRRMHYGQHPRRCRKGHQVHAGRDVCHPCAAQIRRGVKIELTTGPPLSRDEVLDEWVALRCRWPFDLFHERVGITAEAWRVIYKRARKAGDPRAVRALGDPHRGREDAERQDQQEPA